jgi:hypothetical protein
MNVITMMGESFQIRMDRWSDAGDDGDDGDDGVCVSFDNGGRMGEDDRVVPK